MRLNPARLCHLGSWRNEWWQPEPMGGASGRPRSGETETKEQVLTRCMSFDVRWLSSTGQQPTKHTHSTYKSLYYFTQPWPFIPNLAPSTSHPSWLWASSSLALTIFVTFSFIPLMMNSASSSHFCWLKQPAMQFILTFINSRACVCFHLRSPKFFIQFFASHSHLTPWNTRKWPMDVELGKFWVNLLLDNSKLWNKSACFLDKHVNVVGATLRGEQGMWMKCRLSSKILVCSLSQCGWGFHR